MLDCGRGLSRSSTVAGSGSFLVVSWFNGMSDFVKD